MIALAVFWALTTAAHADLPKASLRSMEVWEDPGAQAGIAEVAALAQAQPERFRKTSGTYAGGNSSAALWFKLTLDLPIGDWWLVVLPPFLDDVRLYEPSADGFSERRAGDRQPFSIRETPYRGFCFKMVGDNTGSRTVFLRVTSTSSLLLSPRILNAEELLVTSQFEYGWLLCLIGLMALTAFVSLLSWHDLGDRIHLLFAGSLIIQAVIHSASSGFVAQYLLPDWPLIADGTLSLSVLVGFWLFALFNIDFLDITKRDRVVMMIFRTLQWSALAGIGGLALGYYSEAISVLRWLFVLATLAAIPQVFRLWHRRLPGRVMVVGVTLLNSAGVLLTILMNMGFLPASMLMQHSAYLSAFGTVVLSHLAILARYNRLREERARFERDAALEHAMRLEQEAFIDLIAHEYRTPLSILNGNVELLQQDHLDAPTADRLTRMTAALQRLESLFNRALVREGWETLRPVKLRSLDLTALLHAILADLAPPFSGRSIETHLDPDLRVNADPELLKVILRNLLENAAKYGAPGKPVAISARRRDDHIELAVTNRFFGTLGMEPSRLVERFTRGENSKNQDGQGLGLALVQHLAADMVASLTLRIVRPGHFEACLAFRAE